MQLAFELQAFVASLPAGPQQAAAARNALPEGSLAHRVAANVFEAVSGGRQRVAANQVPASQRRIPLSWIEPNEARVGWLKPVYDHLPRPDPLLRCGREIATTGIYAHAPARHVYDLSGTEWTSLEGMCGLPPQQGGSVVFVIRGDGQELYRSPSLGPSMSERFRVQLAGIQQLELLTEDAGDGNSVDWGMWADAMLVR
jgi:hypothetical protein